MGQQNNDAGLEVFNNMELGEVRVLPVDKSPAKLEVLEIIAVPGGWLMSRITYTKHRIAVQGGPKPTEGIPEAITTTFVPKTYFTLPTKHTNGG